MTELEDILRDLYPLLDSLEICDIEGYGRCLFIILDDNLIPSKSLLDFIKERGAGHSPEYGNIVIPFITPAEEFLVTMAYANFLVFDHQFINYQTPAIIEFYLKDRSSSS